jgi:hypothetical protein
MEKYHSGMVGIKTNDFWVVLEGFWSVLNGFLRLFEGFERFLQPLFLG